GGGAAARSARRAGDDGGGRRSGRPAGAIRAAPGARADPPDPGLLPHGQRAGLRARPRPGSSTARAKSHPHGLMMTELVTADIGGTHARFALARIERGRVLELSGALTLNTADRAGLAEAWQAFADHLGRPLPSAAAFAFAYPVDDDLPQLTNMPWAI